MTVGSNVGMLVGGPVGALIGAAIGAAVGLARSFIGPATNYFNYMSKVQKDNIRSQIWFLGGDTSHMSLFGLQQELAITQNKLMLTNAGHFFNPSTRTLQLSLNGTDVNYAVGNIPVAIPGQFGGQQLPASANTPALNIEAMVLSALTNNPTVVASAVHDQLVNTSSMATSIRDIVM